MVGQFTNICRYLKKMILCVWRQVRAGHGAWHPCPHRPYRAFRLWKLLWRRLQVIFKLFCLARLQLSIVDCLIPIFGPGYWSYPWPRYERHIVFPKVLAQNCDDFNCNNTIYNADQVWHPSAQSQHHCLSQKKSGSVRRHMTSYLSHEVKISHAVKISCEVKISLTREKHLSRSKDLFTK